MMQRALLANSVNLCELWHRRFSQLNYGFLPLLKEMGVGFPDFKVERKGLYKRRALGKHAKAIFPSSEPKSRGILDLIHSNLCGYYKNELDH
jgi:hypothetical protein